MKVQNIAVADCRPSQTNPRGTDFQNDASFKDLVSSVKEKGILVPVIARPDGKGFEVVAGARRLAAAKAAGLDTIPADVREMDDNEAREVQIIENLQRADVHPLDEGEAYRQLHEQQNQEIKTIAVKVGKSVDYVRQRMFLTNLTPAVKKAYLSGEIHDGFAVVIAKLDAGDQAQALTYAIDRANSIKDLEQFVASAIYKPLAYQPWVGKSELEKVVGGCKECPPSRSSLFGDVKEGSCTTLKCWQRKMDAYISYRVKEDSLIKISHEYNYGRDKKKDVLYSNDFTGLSTKTKEHCEFAKQGLVVEGSKVGSLQWVCAEPTCKKHGQGNTPYQQTPAEKAKRKKQLEAERAKEEKEFKAITDAGASVPWPFTENQLNALIAITLGNGNSDPQRRLVKHKGYEILRTKSEWDKKDSTGHPDYRKTLEAEFAKLDTLQKAQLLFEVLLNETSQYDGQHSLRNKAINLLVSKN